MQLTGKVGIVTGAGRGIGRAIALAFASEGAAVVINDVDAGSAGAVAREITARGQQAVAIQGNVADRSEVERVLQATLNSFGRVDVLVNNAGITRDALCLKMSPEEWHAVLNVNLSGVFYCSQAAAREMIKQGSGKIINISSTAALTGNIGQVNYSAAKAGILGLTKTLARELARYNVNVNAIAPGFIDTEMTRAVPERIRAKVLNTIPLGRAGKPEEIASVSVFLASEGASYITGQVIAVNGGRYM